MLHFGSQCIWVSVPLQNFRLSYCDYEDAVIWDLTLCSLVEYQLRGGLSETSTRLHGITSQKTYCTNYCLYAVHCKISAVDIILCSHSKLLTLHVMKYFTKMYWKTFHWNFSHFHCCLHKYNKLLHQYFTIVFLYCTIFYTRFSSEALSVLALLYTLCVHYTYYISILIYNIWGLQGHNTIQSGKWTPTFQRNTLPRSSTLKMEVVCSTHLPDYTVSQPRRLQCCGM